MVTAFMEAFPELPPKGTGFCLSPQSGKTEPSFLTGATNSFQDTLIKCGSGLVVDPQHSLTGYATWDL